MAEQWTETESNLTEDTKNISRAIKTLMEELEATMYYQQRVDVTSDTQLKEVFAHNRDEEIEHACMTLEWLRRNMEGWDEELRTYLFTSKSLTLVEEGSTGEETQMSTSKTTGVNGLGIGKLK